MPTDLAFVYATLSAVGLGIVLFGVLYAMYLDAGP